MTKINKSYVGRLYAIHDQMGVRISALAGDILFGAHPDLLGRLNRLDALSDDLEEVFSEALSEQERDEISSQERSHD